MAGIGPKRHRYGTWVYPPIGVALEMVVLEEIGVYIYLRQNTFVQYIFTRPIMNFCLVAEKNPVMRLSRRWWDHTSLDIMGIRAGNAATEGGGGSEESEAEG